MSNLSTTDLAAALDLSKGRISQYVSEGKLEGCYQGDGRSRRFDLNRVKEALGRNLDPAQMLGNGMKTRRILRKPETESRAIGGEIPKDRRDGKLADGDSDSAELANLAIKQETLRKMRRDNAVIEGQFVLASDVERQVTLVIAQEVAEFEQVLRDGARAIADKLGVEFKAARKILTDLWREHRNGRLAVLDMQAEEAALSDAEKAADI